MVAIASSFPNLLHLKAGETHTAKNAQSWRQKSRPILVMKVEQVVDAAKDLEPVV
jgi:hypothetical protein